MPVILGSSSTAQAWPRFCGGKQGAYTPRTRVLAEGKWPYPRKQNNSDFWVQSMSGVHQIPNRISAAEKAPNMIW
jgi:hypothetical protein